eukprot:SAG11_NODE_2994_length_2783_cov_1.387109_1_plen_695_part_00
MASVEPEPELEPQVAEASPECIHGASEKLWDRIDLACKWGGDGLNSTTELIKFFKKRVVAEQALAQGIRRMNVSEKKLPGRGTSDVIDSLPETVPSVKHAWALMVWNMQQTAYAHEDLASRMNEELVEPLEGWVREKESIYKKALVEGKLISKEILSNSQNLRKMQNLYYKACRDAEAAAFATQASPRASKSVNMGDAVQQEQENYESQVGIANEAEFRLHARSQPILKSLCEIELERIEMTKKAMLDFVNFSAIELPVKVGQPVAGEMLPSIGAIDAEADLKALCDRACSGSPQPGSISFRLYDAVRDVPPENRSLEQLQDFAGGPIHAGWLHKEGHRRKNFKQRWFVVWPVDFQELGWSSPSLFYFDGHDAEALPKGFLHLHGASIGVPKKARKNYPCTIRVDGEEGDGQSSQESSHNKYVLAAENDVKKEEWLAVLGAAAEGKAAKPKLVLFGTTLGGLMATQQKAFPTCNCRVPLIFVDLIRTLTSLEPFSTEGIFRVPGDQNDVDDLKSRYEDGHELGIEASAADIMAWGSLLKLWLRSLKEQIIADSCYDEAIAIAQDGGADAALRVARLKALVEQLPEVNQSVLAHLCLFLSKLDPVASKMTAENLAIVFAPCLFRHPDLMVALNNTRLEIECTKLILQNHGQIFEASKSEADFNALRQLLEELRAAESAAMAEAGGGGRADSDDDD